MFFNDKRQRKFTANTIDIADILEATPEIEPAFKEQDFFGFHDLNEAAFFLLTDAEFLECYVLTVQEIETFAQWCYDVKCKFGNTYQHITRQVN